MIRRVGPRTFYSLYIYIWCWWYSRSRSRERDGPAPWTFYIARYGITIHLWYIKFFHIPLFEIHTNANNCWIQPANPIFSHSPLSLLPVVTPVRRYHPCRWSWAIVIVPSVLAIAAPTCVARLRPLPRVTAPCRLAPPDVSSAPHTRLMLCHHLAEKTLSLSSVQHFHLIVQQFLFMTTFRFSTVNFGTSNVDAM